jgi:RNA polymerase sigma factor (sigma-70 family)
MFKREVPAPSAQEALVERLAREFRGPLKRYFFRRVYSLEEAEDLTHELFVRLVRKKDLSAVDNPEAFMFQVATNLVRDRSRRRQTASSFMEELTADSALYDAISPERVLDAKQSLQIALAALRDVDDKARSIFILHRVEGLKYSEIADIYGITQSAVEKQISKCLVRLAKEVLKKG